MNKDEVYNIITVQDAYFLALAAYVLSRKYKVALEIQVHGFEKLSFFRKEEKIKRRSSNKN